MSSSGVAVGRRVLAVFAHPDDESLLCGGTLAAHVKRGDDVRLLVLGDGVGARSQPGTIGFPQEVAEERQRRLAHFGKACGVLGITQFHAAVLYEDQRADLTAQIRINRFVEDRIADITPEIVYTHFIGDLNLDHRCVAEAVLVATRGLCTVYGAEPEWSARTVGRRFEPPFAAFDITDTIDQKMAAVACYEDEARAFPHPRSPQSLRERAAYRGAQLGTWTYAEAFDVLQASAYEEIA